MLEAAPVPPVTEAAPVAVVTEAASVATSEVTEATSVTAMKPFQLTCGDGMAHRHPLQCDLYYVCKWDNEFGIDIFACPDGDVFDETAATCLPKGESVSVEIYCTMTMQICSQCFFSSAIIFASLPKETLFFQTHEEPEVQSRALPRRGIISTDETFSTM